MPNVPPEDLPNDLLSHLPAADYQRITNLSRLERPHQGAVLRGGDVWFPRTGVIALTTSDEYGRAVQSGVIGREGCVGAEAVVAPDTVMPESVVQIEGTFSVLPTFRLDQAIEQTPALRKVLLGFLYGLSIQSIHIVACNRIHSLHARCCRWLLALQDRTGSAELRMTQESLSLLLGSGRPRVNQLLGTLEDQKFIRLYRGAVWILDRVGLGSMVCDCYRMVHDTIDRINGTNASLAVLSR